MKKFGLFLSLIAIVVACKEQKSTENLAQVVSTERPVDPVKVIPITHGSLILEGEGHVIYIDPTGGASAYKGQKRPTAVFITDIHGDHLSTKTLEELKLEGIPVVAPKAVLDKIPSTIADNTFLAKNNWDYKLENGLSFEVIPMYNLREEALKFHEKGRGNGYVINLVGQRVYISGDTEDIPEMRALEDIDKAFVCMNLPYTMTVDSAADAVLEFQPKKYTPITIAVRVD